MVAMVGRVSGPVRAGPQRFGGRISAGAQDQGLWRAAGVRQVTAMRVEEHRSAERLIGATYGAAAGEISPMELLASFGREFPAVGVGYSLFDGSRGKPVCLSLITHGIDKSCAETCSAMAEHNPWQRVITGARIGFHRRHSVLDERSYRSSVYYNEWARPWGIEASSHILVARDGSRHAALSVLLPTLGEAEAERVDAVLGAVAPHMVRAATISRSLAQADAMRASLEERLASADAASALVRWDGFVEFLSPQAEKLVAAGHLVAVKGGKLRFTDSVAQRQVDAALRRFEATHGVPGAGAATPAPVPPIRLRPPVGLASHVVDLVAVNMACDGWQALGCRRALVIMRRAHEERPAVELGTIAKRLGLSHGEASVAAALAAGETVQSYAAKRGVSVETVRVMLKRAFRKTSCHRQSELVALVLTTG
jgi:DNA-binding CsgD family transcriptional regulator